MKLDPDCIRDVLIATESLEFGGGLTVDKIHDQFPQYSEEDIEYTCLKLGEGGYIAITTVSTMRCNLDRVRLVTDLTFQGHEYLNNIRDNNVWKQTKSIAKKVGSFSLYILGKVAS